MKVLYYTVCFISSIVLIFKDGDVEGREDGVDLQPFLQWSLGYAIFLFIPAWS